MTEEKAIKRKLKLLEAEKNQIFQYTTETCDAARNLDSGAKQSAFLKRAQCVEAHRAEFVKVAEDINLLELELNPEAKIDLNFITAFNDLYGVIKYYMAKLTSKEGQSSSTTINVTQPPEIQPSAHPDSEYKIKLQPLQLPMFNGNVADWPLFYAMFKANVHDRQDMSKTVKMQYLISKLSGKALSVCAGIPPTDVNYDVIFKALINKYDDKRALAAAYLDTLFQFKPIKQESAMCLANFVDMFGSTVAALRALNLDMGELLLFYIANSKLNEETRQAFETSLQEEMPTYNKLVEFVTSRSKILSRVNPGTSNDFKYKSKNPAPHTFLVNNSSNGHCSSSSRNYNLKINTEMCILCGKNHILSKCDKFLALSPRERYVIVKQHALCVNCLGSSHRAYECNSKLFCSVCKLKHNSLLHFNSKQVEVTVDSSSNHNNLCASLCSGNSSMSENTVLLSTVKVVVNDKNSKPHILRFILDSGSMCNIITKEACKLLDLHLNQVCTNIKGIGSNSSHVYGQVLFKFLSRFDPRINYTVKALVVENVVEKLPSQVVDCAHLNHLNNIRLADDDFMTPGKIDGILGAQIYPFLLDNHSIIGKENQPIALLTKLGYVIMGNAPILNKLSVDNNCIENNFFVDIEPHCMFQHANLDQLDSQINKFWEIETIPRNKDLELSPDEKMCEMIFNEKVARDQQGIYHVPLPFKDSPEQLGDSFHVACRRLLHLEKKLEASVELKQGYHSAIMELIDNNFMVVSDDQSKTSGYFIPHHMISKPDSPSSKLRVVYDASCKTSTGSSLNDILHTGPKLYADLLQILLNFRLFPFALNGDITKMFLQIKLLPEFWKYQKILWRFSQSEKIMVYELRVVTFGTRASPYLALRTVKKLVEDEKNNFPVACREILQSLYMDDCVVSFLKQEEALTFYQEVVDLFARGGFQLTKWSSNSNKILDHIPHSDRLCERVAWLNENNFSHKILGMRWNTNQDCLFFKIDKINKPCTKRGILSSILTMYDPMGLLAPVVLFVKLLIKELWQVKLEWDDLPPQYIVNSWKNFVSEMHFLENITFPRHISVVENCKFELIGFGDASLKAYGAQIYSKVTSPDGTVSVTLICARSKISPVKVESIPRLELCALLLLSELMKLVVDSYNYRYKIDNVFCFTDSSVALCWVSSSPHLWNVFVANRVSRVQQNVSVQDIFHINGEDNPADCLSRGLLPSQLVAHELWFHGPSWLKLEFKNWPIKNYSAFKSEIVPEQKASITLVGINNGPSENYLIACFNRMVSWKSLLNVMVYILRFIGKLKPLSFANFVSAQDLNFAELIVIKIIQSHFFVEDIDKIKKGLICSPSMKKLCPFLDKDNILRVGGRLGNSQQNYDQQHPILLPSKCHVVDLIIDYVHKKNFHTGPHLLLSLLRQKYWILNGRNLARKCFHACNLCFRHNPKFVYPKMGELPAARVVGIKPFLNTACDFLGPITITISGKRGQKSQKAYICLFICLSTKALHLEVASDLSTPVFMNALKRFLARRGPVKSILSDNGTNFVGAKNKLDEIYKLLESDDYKTQFSNELADNRIQWIFNPPSSPHFGGIFESNIKSFKTHLLKVIGSQILSYEELNTLTVQIESLLNSRPLCQITSDPSDGEMLTPNHFLKLTPLQHIPAMDVSCENIGRLSRYQMIDNFVQSFWKRWSVEYLNSLQTREKWFSNTNNILPGTVVIIKQENVAPLNWLRGVITEVFPGKDGIVRVANVRTPRGEFRRPVCKLAPLPLQ